MDKLAQRVLAIVLVLFSAVAAASAVAGKVSDPSAVAGERTGGR